MINNFATSSFSNFHSSRRLPWPQPPLYLSPAARAASIGGLRFSTDPILQLMTISAISKVVPPFHHFFHFFLIMIIIPTQITFFTTLPPRKKILKVRDLIHYLPVTRSARLKKKNSAPAPAIPKINTPFESLDAYLGGSYLPPLGQIKSYLW